MDLGQGDQKMFYLLTPEETLVIVNRMINTWHQLGTIWTILYFIVYIIVHSVGGVVVGYSGVVEMEGAWLCTL